MLKWLRTELIFCFGQHIFMQSRHKNTFSKNSDTIKALMHSSHLCRLSNFGVTTRRLFLEFDLTRNFVTHFLRLFFRPLYPRLGALNPCFKVWFFRVAPALQQVFSVKLTQLCTLLLWHTLLSRIFVALFIRGNIWLQDGRHCVTKVKTTPNTQILFGIAAKILFSQLFAAAAARRL